MSPLATVVRHPPSPSLELLIPSRCHRHPPPPYSLALTVHDNHIYAAVKQWNGSLGPLLSGIVFPRYGCSDGLWRREKYCEASS